VSAHRRIIAAAFLPRLALESAAQESALENRVIVLRPARSDWQLRSVQRIVDATDDLRALGVAPPMRLCDAQRFAPALDVTLLDETQLSERLLFLAELCLAASPIVEPGPSGIFLDLTGIPDDTAVLLARIQAVLADAGHVAAVAASPGRRLSEALARAAYRYRRQDPSPPLVVEEERADAALARLPISVLGLSPELHESLDELGLHTAQDLRRAQSVGLAPRLREEARAVFDLLSLHDQAPLKPIPHPEQLTEQLELDEGIRYVEPLLFALRPLFQRLCLRLKARRRLLSALEITLRVRPGIDSMSADVPWSTREDVGLTLRFPVPLDDEKAVLRAFAARLERSGLPGEVERVILFASGTAERVVGQAVLPFDGVAGASRHEVESRLGALIAELVGELGPTHVGGLRLRASLLPEQMTELVWPGQGTVTDGDASAIPPGFFAGGWPWPIRLLSMPMPVGVHEIAKAREFCVLEGVDDRERPFSREYRVLVFKDGRRALGVWDSEVEQVFVQGWFD